MSQASQGVRIRLRACCCSQSSKLLANKSPSLCALRDLPARAWHTSRQRAHRVISLRHLGRCLRLRRRHGGVGTLCSSSRLLRSRLFLLCRRHRHRRRLNSCCPSAAGRADAHRSCGGGQDTAPRWLQGDPPPSLLPRRLQLACQQRPGAPGGAPAQPRARRRHQRPRVPASSSLGTRSRRTTASPPPVTARPRRLPSGGEVRRSLVTARW